ncbi:MAG: thermonuclease family protein [Rhodospirillales bacterium]|nr:thermonuclease family protein [Rhodospirillales bacterium]
MSQLDTGTGSARAAPWTFRDGATIVVRPRIWLGQDIDTQVRLDGVDAPEIRGKCDRERRLAERARDLISSSGAAGTVVLSEIRYGKYAGRVVARVRAPGGEDFSTALLKAGLGRVYEGGRRASWCDGP